ncbi:MAG: tetratricopeptide repeat protein [Verrucomicrobiota bacterium]
MLLALMVFAVFGRTVRHEFVNLDDDTYVYQNPVIIKGLTFQGVSHVFTRQMCDFYHPLTMLSLMLDHQVYGLNPGGYHLTNVLLHATTTILLFLVLRRMMGHRAGKSVGTGAAPGDTLWPCAFVAAVFATHPLRVESVAWVTERKDMLSGLFFVLTLGAYVRYARTPFSLVRYLAVIFLFALGLLSKPSLVTLPFLLLLLDYWPLVRMQPAAPCSTFKVLLPLIIEKIPLFVLSAAACVATILTQQYLLAPVGELPLLSRTGYAAVSYVVYLVQMFYPEGLAVIYPFPRQGLSWPEVAGALALLAGISVGVLALRQRRPYLLVGWLWYLGMLVPMLGVIHAGSVARADRFTYLAQMGVYIMIAWAARDLTISWRSGRRLLGMGALSVIVALMVCTWKQTSYWRNSESLWTHTIACTSDNALAQMDLGVMLTAQGRLDEAIEHFQMALEIHPNYPDCHNNLAFALLQKGQVDEAIMHYQKALEMRPDYAGFHNGLGNALVRKGQVDEAMTHYQKAIQLKPDYADAHNNLANMLAKKGQLDEAVVQYQKAIQLNPDSAETYYNLGAVLGLQGQLAEAGEQYQKAIEIKPDYADAHGNLANVLATRGRLDEAVQEYRRTLELVPNSAQAHFRFGQALQTLHNFAAAETEYQKVLELDSKHLPAHVSLAWLLATCPEASLRDGNKAVELGQQAEQLAGGESPQILDTLAAAYAEAGRFGEAVETARRALNLSATKNNQPLADAVQTRLELYETHSPYHEKP